MILRFCIECGAPLQQRNQTAYRCQNGHDYYNNPRPTVSVVLLKDATVLVSKRGREPAKGLYDLPGGFIENGEGLSEAAAREMKEEAGITLDAKSLQILGVYPGQYMENVSLLEIIVLAEHWEGEPVAADDSAALEWQPLAFFDSPQFDPDYPGLREQLTHMLHEQN